VRNLEQRLERLEQAFGGRQVEMIVVAMVEFVSVSRRPIAGWKDNHGFVCPRLSGESDEALAARAEAEGRVRATRCPTGAILLLSYTDRGE
jgi:hypothetical protein